MSEPKFTRDLEISKGGKLPIILAAPTRWKDQPITHIADIGGDVSAGTGDFQEDWANANLYKTSPKMYDMLEYLLKKMRKEQITFDDAAGNHVPDNIAALLQEARGER